MVSKELLRTKQLFAVDISEARRLLSQATAKKDPNQSYLSHQLVKLYLEVHSQAKATYVNAFAGFVCVITVLAQVSL